MILPPRFRNGKRLVVSRAAKPGEEPVEALSEDRIEIGRRLGKQAEELAAATYYAFANQRGSSREEIITSLLETAKGSFEIDGWCRALKQKYADVPLSCLGSLKDLGGRFNIGAFDTQQFPAFPALYIAQEPQTVIAEVFLGEQEKPSGTMTPYDLALTRSSSFSCIRLRGHIESYVDLEDPEVLKPFVATIGSFKMPRYVRELAKSQGERPSRVITTVPLLLETLLDPNWRFQPRQYNLPANSQVFGQLVVGAGIQAIKFPSARNGGRPCIVIFPQNFPGTSAVVEVADEVPASVVIKKMTAENWKHLCT